MSIEKREGSISDNKPSIRLFGLRLVFEANILALLAFLLSISSLTLQGVQMLRGAQIDFSIGERVNLVHVEPKVEDHAAILVVNARLDYVNSGAIGQGAIISRERLEIQFGEETPYEYRWLHFELFVPDKTGKAKSVTEDAAHSFIVPGAGAESHQTTFVGFRDATVTTRGNKAAAVTWADFLMLLETEHPVTLRFIAMDRLGRTYEAECIVAANATLLDTLRENKWGTALCEEDSQLPVLPPGTAKRAPSLSLPGPAPVAQ